jgi:outer membrane biosynthesis protein TonB
MINFLKRFFLFFFPILACLFLLILLVPVTASADTTRPVTAKSSLASFYAPFMQPDTPTPVPTIGSTPTPTVAPTPTPTTAPTPTPTVAPTPTPMPTTEPATPTPTVAPTPTPTTVPTPNPTPTPTTGGNTNTNTPHTALNALIFTMGGVGVILVIVGVVLYFVYSRSM